ncbi:MAG: FABP family protein [Steroidobacteraceae bacterium]
MSAFPEDVYTEQSADPDTLANLGPLRRLAGIWESQAGIDINPKADGPQRREYSERIELQPIDAQSNGPQLFYGLRYHTRILAPDEDATFHDQTGYWLWEPATGLVLQTLSIPRGQVAIAAGHTTPDANELVLTAERGRTDYGICSTAFLEYAFRTDSYRIEVVFNPDGSWSYVLDTLLMVHGRAEPFLHRDRNTLRKVAEPTPNPLAALRASG